MSGVCFCPAFAPLRTAAHGNAFLGIPPRDDQRKDTMKTKTRKTTTTTTDSLRADLHAADLSMEHANDSAEWLDCTPRADKDGKVPVSLFIRLAPITVAAVVRSSMIQGIPADQVIANALGEGKDLLDDDGGARSKNEPRSQSPTSRRSRSWSPDSRRSSGVLCSQTWSSPAGGSAWSASLRSTKVLEIRHWRLYPPGHEIPRAPSSGLTFPCSREFSLRRKARRQHCRP